MAFHFPLDAVLHFRKSIQHQQENRLRLANQQVSLVGRLLEQTKDRIRADRDLRERDLSAGTTAAELAMEWHIEVSLTQQVHALENELARLQILRDEQLRLFEKVNREREILDSLHDQQQRAYLRRAAHKEQRRIDDLFLQRRGFSPGSS
jgi:flagellar export protein FliJ